MNRRKFVLSALISSLILYLGGWWAFKVRSRDSSDMVTAILRKRLDYLILDEAGLDQFAADIQDVVQQDLNYAFSWLGILAPIYQYTQLFEGAVKAYHLTELENTIVIQYLMSTDFFINNADMTQPVKYIGFYDPYRRICFNPFAKFK